MFLNVVFTLVSYEASWQCLASWPGPRGENYITFLDTSPTTRTKYRCGVSTDVG